MDHVNYTGIPTDLLLIGFSTVLGGIGVWAIGEIRALRKEANKRGLLITTLKINVQMICRHLKLKFFEGESE